MLLCELSEEPATSGLRPRNAENDYETFHNRSQLRMTIARPKRNGEAAHSHTPLHRQRVSTARLATLSVQSEKKDTGEVVAGATQAGGRAVAAGPSVFVEPNELPREQP
jgi:hypothetical protein